MLIIEYKNNYQSLNDNTNPNVFMKLISLCRNGVKQFGNKLLDYQGLDKDILICYLNMAMTSVSTVKFKERMMYDKLSEVTTVSEEAFALLVFENNFERWTFLANKELNMSMLNEEGGNGVEEEIDNEATLPDTLYQRKVKTRKDNRETAGQWTNEGIARLNELSDKIKETKNSNCQEAIELDLTERYANSAHDSSEAYRKKKRRMEEALEANKKRIMANNMLDVMTL
jgi:hypothetical protein